MAHRPWFIGLSLWLVAACLQPTLAQTLETRLEVRFSTGLAISNAPLTASWGLGARLEARYDLSPLRFQLVLDPGVSFSRSVTPDAGLTELYALYREGELDVSAGLERLPLEVARLALPYSLEPVSPLGNRQGRWGGRVSWNPEATRLRLAVLEAGGRLVPALSLRREFGEFELEAHALYPARPVVGLGGSGTVAGLVVYGEGWLLLNPSEARYALGLSGSLGEGWWTLEGGYATTLPLLPASHFLAGQWTLPLGEEARWNLSTYLLLEHPLRVQLSSGYIYLQPNYELNATLNAWFTYERAVLNCVLWLRAFP
ncbi:MAG: hypothetical protein RMK51_04250 [Meiothermus sp.]|uniref:hypothetical protein n=1 Tax=Meiothermus sp. TaxID=1955249 RepID=UPI0025E641E3|nr:hypothetical protein [Meiothermus sp.]MCS7068730.1 hypothetical protein [Meiothermus sp.]MDW8425122.1 hypothetical protein [Meiothermus sp.]